MIDKYALLWTSVFAHAHMKDITFIEANLEIQQYRDSSFPHFPVHKDEYDGLMDLVYSTCSYANWYLEYPEEVEFFSWLTLDEMRAKENLLVSNSSNF